MVNHILPKTILNNASVCVCYIRVVYTLLPATDSTVLAEYSVIDATDRRYTAGNWLKRKKKRITPVQGAVGKKIQIGDTFFFIFISLKQLHLNVENSKKNTWKIRKTIHFAW